MWRVILGSQPGGLVVDLPSSPTMARLAGDGRGSVVGSRRSVIAGKSIAKGKWVGEFFLSCAGALQLAVIRPFIAGA